MLLILLLMILYLSFESKNFKFDIKDVIIILFLILAIISFCYSQNKDISLMGDNNRYEGILMLGTYVIIYLTAKKFFKYEDITKFLNIMFYVSLAIGILGVFHNYINYPALLPIFGKGIAGTFTNTNFFGSYISIALPISIAVFIFTNNKKSFALSIILFFDMIASGTRSSWVAFAGVGLLGLIYLIKQKDKKFWKRSLILLGCFVAIFIFLFFGIFGSIHTKNKIKSIQNDISSITQNGISDDLGTDRIEIWKMTIKLIKQFPIFGVGPDNLRSSLAIYCTEEFYNYGKMHLCIPDKAHNEYLQIAATLGIPALILYLVFIGFIIFPKMAKMFKNKTTLIFTICICSYLIQAFFNISTIGVAPLFWMILGFADNKNGINDYNFDIIVEKNEKNDIISKTLEKIKKGIKDGRD